MLTRRRRAGRAPTGRRRRERRPVAAGWCMPAPARRVLLPAPIRLAAPRQSARRVVHSSLVLLPLRSPRSITSRSPPTSTSPNSASRLRTAEPPRLDPLRCSASTAQPSRPRRGSADPRAVHRPAARSSTRSTRRSTCAPVLAAAGRLVGAAAAAGLDRGAGALLEGPGRPVLRPRQRHRRRCGCARSRPSDALRLAQAVVAACEQLVNDLSGRARRDALRHAEAELAAGREPGSNRCSPKSAPSATAKG